MSAAEAPTPPDGRARAVRALRAAEPHPDEAVLPGEVALAAYRVLQAFRLLSDLASTDLPEKLARSIDAEITFDRGTTPPCRDCGVEVHLGLPHADACLSDEALLRRKAPVPKIIPR